MRTTRKAVHNTAPSEPGAGGTSADPPVLSEDIFQTKVAEAAYFLAQRRGLAPGCERDGWLATEARLRQYGGGH